MIQEIKRVRESVFSGNYGKYFLAFEAPGDTETPRRNMKTVTVKPNNRVRLDFTNNLVVDEMPDVAPEPDDPLPDVVDAPTNDLPDMEEPADDTLPDVAAGVGDDLPDANTNTGDTLPAVEPNQTPELPGVAGASDQTLPNIEDPGADALPDVEVDLDTGNGMPDVNDPVENDNVTVSPQETNPDEDYTADANTGETTPPENPEGGTDDGTETPGDDNTDFTQVGDGEAGNDAEGTDANTDGNEDGNEDRGPGLEYDSVRKYNLYKEFSRLRSSVSTYIAKLESCISDDQDSNQIIKECTRRFREIHDLITDYMMMKYELCNYVQNLLFYQKMIATVQMVFKLLKTANRLYEKGKDTRK